LESEIVLPVHRIGVSVPPELLEEFDRTMREMGFRDRSKAIQAAMRGFITDFEFKKRRVRVLELLSYCLTMLFGDLKTL